MTASDKPYRGADGRYHFLYCTEHVDTRDYYLGKHSTENLDDGYQGSGDWIKLWRALARDRLRTTPFEFVDSEEDAFAAEKELITLEVLTDPRCRNFNEGGDGRTSEGMHLTLARPEIKARHIADVNARWAKQEERDQAAAKTAAAFAKPEIRAKYVKASRLRWEKPEEREKDAVAARARFAKPGEKEKQSDRIRPMRRNIPKRWHATVSKRQINGLILCYGQSLSRHRRQARQR